MGKWGKRLQNSNHEIELLQQDLDDALQEIDGLKKQNNSMMGKVTKLIGHDNELYHDFFGLTTQNISTLEEMLESLDQGVNDIF